MTPALRAPGRETADRSLEVLDDLPHRLLLVGSSARMLAQSGARAGIRPVSIDLFADRETRACSAYCEAVNAADIGFERESLLRAAARLAPAGYGYALVYGSGLDADSAALEELARGRTLYGNPPEILRLLKTPDAFFETLRRLGIPYPESSRKLPPDPENWLLKSARSEGGKGVRPCSRVEPDSSAYYQRRLPGKALSALFLANGEDARIIGFNTLRTAGHLVGQPFLFAGAVNRADLTPEQRRQVQTYVARLARAVSLRGLNSLDFMLDGETCRVLEVNPRPSATMALYDDDFPHGLLAAHIRACRGEMPDEMAASGTVRAFKVFFAPFDLEVSEETRWPEWCTDTPVTGTRIGVGQPVCTVCAEGTDQRQVECLIERLESELFERLYAARS
ncbi:ATP-grasp domain-containing protein [Methylocaldum szegediense]|uniref:ATP-grasp superfamily ATP-dependent carboligase n=1 Tax=Methylocaldum szegediense TaxID=73780 RepID=A0ABM9I447_9GAMM|nr:ATP-grasp domain-containing protein [Methylocaldum szegediense]CAI8873080.1 putative ATP-grasp superfamily ATP-dependent carboligase [Methylocaldum szegediense]